MIAAHRLCLTASGRVVLEGDPAAVSLLVGVGGTVPAQYEDEYKALTSEPEPDAYPAVLQKAVAPVADKAIKPAANKTKKRR